MLHTLAHRVTGQSYHGVRLGMIVPAREGASHMRQPGVVTASTCPTERDLAAFDQGYLSDDDIDRVAAHLGTACPRCAEVLARLGSGADEFTNALRNASPAGSGDMP